jgi:hypothetical protein
MLEKGKEVLHPSFRVEKEMRSSMAATEGAKEVRLIERRRPCGHFGLYKTVAAMQLLHMGLTLSDIYKMGRFREVRNCNDTVSI